MPKFLDDETAARRPTDTTGTTITDDAAATDMERLESTGRRPPRRSASVGRVAWLIGPALVAGVAYLDPGNVASNMTTADLTEVRVQGE